MVMLDFLFFTVQKETTENTQDDDARRTKVIMTVEGWSYVTIGES